MSSRLERQILEVLRPRVGERLEAVQYRCYDDEATLEDLSDPDFLLEELLLRFTGGDIFVTWAEDAGWEFLFTVQALTSSQFHTGSLESYDAREVPCFRSLVGQRLVSAVVFGWNATPFGIRFTFPTGSVSIGSGDQTIVDSHAVTYIGDGDQVVVRGPEFRPERTPDTLWSSEEPNRVFEAPEPIDRPVEIGGRPQSALGGSLPLLLFGLGVLGLAVALHVPPVIGIPIAIGVVFLSATGYRIGEGFGIHLLRMLLMLGALGVVFLIIKIRWFG